MTNECKRVYYTIEFDRYTRLYEFDTFHDALEHAEKVNSSYGPERSKEFRIRKVLVTSDVVYDSEDVNAVLPTVLK